MNAVAAFVTIVGLAMAFACIIVVTYMATQVSRVRVKALEAEVAAKKAELITQRSYK